MQHVQPALEFSRIEARKRHNAIFLECMDLLVLTAKVIPRRAMHGGAGCGACDGGALQARLSLEDL